MSLPDRNRFILYISLLAITVFLGLMSRSSLIEVPEFIALYAGDTLWGGMVYWLTCMLLPDRQIKIKVLVAILFSFSIELSQLYQAQWINEIRSYRLGGLILGYGFKLSDLFCYTLGISFTAFIDRRIIQRDKLGD